MKFLVPNYSCLQNPVLSVLCPQLNMLNPPPSNKIPGYAMVYGIGGSCFTDVMLHSSVCYHQEHSLPAPTEPHRLHKKDYDAYGAVIQHLHGVANL